MPSTIVQTVTSARLFGAEPGLDLSGLEIDDSGWVDVAVPGSVRSALVAASLLEDPNTDPTDARDSWVDEREWWYRFALEHLDDLMADDTIELRFDGIDTFADVYVDGDLVHQNRNMFRSARLDVTATVSRPAPHVVAVRFKRPLAMIGTASVDSNLFVGGPQRHMRKAQFGFGWDFAPARPSMGLWKAVEIRRVRSATIESVRFQTLRLDQQAATVGIDCFVAVPAGVDSARVDVTLREPSGQVVLRSDAPVIEGVARLLGVVHHPRCWWPHDLGDPTLYRLDVGLVTEDQQVDKAHLDVGIRTIELDESADPDQPGARFFRFAINGRPFFAKGANWIPADTEVGAIIPETYTHLLYAAVAANMNMLRVWGGGIYEHDVFYDMCDELGILVWQDFGFACAEYDDQDETWCEDIRVEAREVVQRLRSHPCMALWCGNNEVEVVANLFGATGRSPGAGLFYDLLPAVVAQEDGMLAYVPTSPVLGSDARQGDSHSWQVWHGFDATASPAELAAMMQAAAMGSGVRLDPRSKEGRAKAESFSARRYLTDKSRFVSEFGMQSVPARETLLRWIPPAQMQLASTQLTGRTRDHGPLNKLELAISAVAGDVTSVEDLIDLSQLMQAEGLKLGIEHYRRRWPACAGTLIWQLNDCWPAPSWSLIDYAGRPKAAYWYAKRSFSPAIASLHPEDTGDVSLWIVNDKPSPLTDRFELRLSTFAGRTLWAAEIQAEVGPATARPVARWDSAEVIGGVDRYLTVRAQGESTPTNRLFFAQPKDLDRRTPVLETETRLQSDGRLGISVTTEAFALFVHVTADDPRVMFDDNFVDLEAGERRVLTTAEPFFGDPAQLVVACR